MYGYDRARLVLVVLLYAVVGGGDVVGRWRGKTARMGTRDPRVGGLGFFEQLVSLSLVWVEMGFLVGFSITTGWESSERNWRLCQNRIISEGFDEVITRKSSTNLTIWRDYCYREGLLIQCVFVVVSRCGGTALLLNFTLCCRGIKLPYL